MEIARGTDLPDLLTSLGYTVTRVGHYHSTKEMDSLRIKNRRTWYRYSEQTGGRILAWEWRGIASRTGQPGRDGRKLLVCVIEAVEILKVKRLYRTYC